MKHYTNTTNPVDFPHYEAVPLEAAQPFWDERNRVLRARSEALVIALVGKDLAPQWWTSANRAFEGQTPSEQFECNAERVYSYLMRMSEGEW
jgi:hypothetical protein